MQTQTLQQLLKQKHTNTSPLKQNYSSCSDTNEHSFIRIEHIVYVDTHEEKEISLAVVFIVNLKYTEKKRNKKNKLNIF